MSKINSIKLTVISGVLIGLLGCTTTNPTDAPQVSKEGLELVKSTNSTVAYKKLDVDFSEYDSVLILPSQVAFKKNWKNNYNSQQISSALKIRDKDIIRIKSEVTRLFDKEFKEEFSRDANFPLVEEVSSNTLIIRPAVINLDVAAPYIRSAVGTRNYTRDAGEATLYLELFDGVSGEVLARIIDAEVAGDNGFYGWGTRVSNSSDATRLFRKWAKALRTHYDAAHAAKVSTPLN